MLVLDIKHLNKHYEHFSLKDVSFQLEKGYIMGFIGINGAGKTTTIKSILNLISMDGGEIHALGKNITQHEVELKQEIGYAFGDINFYSRNKIKTLTNVIKTFYRNWDDNTYRKYLKKFNLIEDKKIAELSTGMKVKYSLALALSHGAKLLILDEPTSGLDPAARDNLLSIFQELVQDGEISILFSTHVTSDLEKCADYITYIHDGQIVNSAEKEAFVDAFRLLNGTKEQLEQVKDRLISYKTNSFGFTGLIHTKDFEPSPGIVSAIPNLEEIMIYYSRKEEAYV
ncbi:MULTISPECIES: ABC transporter ATP-binding protein [unclassified Paenibacillus]|uniref:ABC transporter ATP-binding protein n=1 Tax=unclassified Paenibacillus TaxID=185978 RepID=UPI002405EB39|nr:MULTISPECIES: ABC transporter ATP-binding protein [unclassified Paenibacillus]MDF9841704.1 ABC-2 type transport system ATP-binding protein [Paenibacillus sp. PastF-2]MDF9848184.1 ABC-2 type transport system ATP-binding protein [Paenibacillus sp. PastM-2]MDF9854863.1 ABC-2 type transport system ATP-binding protein [Paenibacillus sp. PastF-1]MDH6480133.1 ABC-2 type transport system ATP-binding protein [Paenibacillus sp. PastH-2]MDH6507564.1 ABC-2 type transport system ATP-binding protein [Pae